MFMERSSSFRTSLGENLAQSLEHIRVPANPSENGEGALKRLVRALVHAYMLWLVTKLDILFHRWKTGTLPPPPVAPLHRAKRTHHRRPRRKNWLAELIDQACEGQTPVMPRQEEPEERAMPLPEIAPSRPAPILTWKRPQPRPRRIVRARWWEDPGWA